EAARRTLQDSDDLLPPQVKPLHDVLDRGPGLEVFKYQGDRHACAFEHPSSAHFTRDALYSRALRPIKNCHAILLLKDSISLSGSDFATRPGQSNIAFRRIVIIN